MRGSAYQATMEDMRKAGLNPILAYQRGPTPSGQGSVAKMPDFGQVMSMGMQAGAAVDQAVAAKGVKAAQSRQLGEQTEHVRQQRMGVEYDNVAKRHMAEWYQTPEGKVALQGKGIGGIWGPPAATAVEVGRKAGEYIRQIPETFGRQQREFRKWRDDKFPVKK